MFRFLLVADEGIIRRGFETKIDWSDAGFEFLPPCENDRDAIATIDALRPDIIMTDFRCLTPAAFQWLLIYWNIPEMVIVVLSGYDECSYSQSAIRKKVFAFVLKPVSSQDLTTLLAKIKNKLEADRRTRENMSTLQLNHQ